MINATPFQNLVKVHRDLWSAIHLVAEVERQIVGQSPAWSDLVDVENVLRHTVGEVALIMKRNASFLEKSLNIRQAEEFALKAKVAKASGVAPAHRQLCPGDQSHK